ncbi:MULTISPECIES: family 43 glycosylhydrolase [unclassified Rathayibacter]|uniref:family 43 glycosylhydrolase n=1 Tax=unclassified Rathayibacter TaxID=2609250 RepID=UPI00188B814A|nr:MULTISPECIES: family 43 glycosylhydrolase [unclassified Rathayibacter]MBF4461199.1 family 43 glycosylhydrolase [Rathayibacter sp. VKM Ac-2879]MBF4502610.1 family 43 glycosylhydrolase [Rathayibacter sp. VKM Ac-2878]
MKPLLRPLVIVSAIALAVPLLTAQTAIAAPSDSSLVLRYALDETSGTVAVDSSGKGRNGTLVNGAAPQGSAGVKLDGANDYVKLPDNVLAGLTSVTVSTEVLVSPSQGTPYFIWGLGNTTNGAGNGYLYTTGNSYKTSIASGNWQTEQTVNSNANLDRGVWKTLTYTLDDASDTAKLYLDGTQVAQQTGVTITPGSLGNGSTTADYIGRSVYDADKYLTGSVRDFRIYNTALSASDVASIQATDATRATRDLAALDLGDLNAVTANLTLPTSGPNGSTISWASSNTAVISNSGAVTRPASGTSTVTLTATASRGSATQTRTFTAKVPAQDTNADAQKALDAISIPNSGDIRGNVTLPTRAGGAYDVSWSSSNTAVVSTTGVVTRPASTSTVTVTASVPGTTATRQIPLTVTAAPVGLDTNYDASYLWTHFGTTDYEKIYFGASDDGLHWSKLNNNKPILANLAGTLGVRDPHLVRSPTGDEYWILGTDLHAEGTAPGGTWDQTNASQKLVIWRSTDLVHWSDQSLVFAGFADAGNVWAPEAMWDATTGQYYVYWASRDKTKTGSASAQRVYVTTTRDFMTFTTPTIWLDENPPQGGASGGSIIDTTIAKEGNTFYRFSTSDWRTVVDTATSLAGPWTRVIARGEDTAHGLSDHIEGLTVYQLPDGRWVVMGDNGGYSAYVTNSLASLQFTALQTGTTGANTYSFSAPFRHGSVLRLSSAEEARINAAYSATAGPAPKTANAAGEILRYTFDQVSGTTVTDASGNGQNGTLVSGATAQNGAVTFDGTDDYIKLPDNLLAGITDITVQTEVWIDPNQRTPYFIYGLGNTSNGVGNGYLFTTGDGYRTSITAGDYNSEQTVSQGTAVPRGRWAQLTYTLAGSTATIFLDGVKVGSGTVTVEPKDIGGGVTTANYIGRSNYDGDNRFRGQIREFAIYNRALSSSEVLNSSGNTTALADVTLSGDVLKTAPIIDAANRVVTFPVKRGTSLTALTPTYLTASGVTASPASGTVRNLSTPQTVVLTPAGGGATTTWTFKAIEVKSPVLPGYYADPNIAVFGDTYYIYATTDGTPGWGGNTFYVWSSKNLVDWTRSDKPFLTLDGANGNVPWAVGNAWAPTIIQKNGKYYFYFSGHNASLNRKTIGVAVADSPMGPFTAQPTAMITNGESVNSGQAIDPDAFTDPATGKSYLFWGNGSPVYGELSDDMLTIKPGTIKPISGLTDFREGSFVNYRQGLYHLTYSIDDTGSENYRVGYATATSVDGPWTYRGVILEKDPSLGILATGHNSIINVPGTDDWYIAYHRFAIPGGDGTHRETTIDKLTFDPTTGLMQKVTPTLQSVAPQTISVAPAIAVKATATTRCITGKVVLTMTATNPNAFPVKMAIGSSYGSTTVAEVGAGKTVSYAFTTRATSVPAGSASATATAFVSGKPASASATAPYAALSCG